MNMQEAVASWQADAPRLAALGVHLPDVQMYATPESKRDYTLAMDAQPSLATVPSAGIPAMLTTSIDPVVTRILFAPTKAATILGEVQKGSWVDDTMLFPVVEQTGEVSSYGDFNDNGHTGANVDFPQRQNYLFQTIKEYGERELDRYGLARINYVTELDQAAASVLTRFANTAYFLGLQNYGVLNDPLLPAAITPGVKAAGNGNVWITPAGVMNATANEVYADIQSLFWRLVSQTGGLVDKDTKMVLAMSPGSQVALSIKNSFGLSALDMLKEFPNLRFETAVQYGLQTAGNPQGIAAGNFVQLIAEELDGQQTGYVAYSEKMRQHPVIRAMSSYRQKVTAGVWGAVIRVPVAFASMIGV
jgi:hypothetical protein